MLTRTLMLAAALAVAPSVQAAAETSDDGKRLVFGQGTQSCGAWTRSREIKNMTGLSREQTAQAMVQVLLEQWVVGFLSGVNLSAALSAETTDPDILIEGDWDGWMAWVDNYCKANPLAKVSTAAVMLANELRSRARRR